MWWLRFFLLLCVPHPFCSSNPMSFLYWLDAVFCLLNRMFLAVSARYVWFKCISLMFSFHADKVTKVVQQKSITGWWFGTCFIFPYIGNVIIPTDFHIFQRGRSTTNQIMSPKNFSVVLPGSMLFLWPWFVARCSTRSWRCRGRWIEWMERVLLNGNIMGWTDGNNRVLAAIGAEITSEHFRRLE